MTETQERFLRSILTRVPLDDIVEMHLFPPIRRGTMETGVAVIATLLPPVPLTVVDADEPASDVMHADTGADHEHTAESLSADETVAVAETLDTADVAEMSDDATEMTDDDVITETDDSPYADEPVAVAEHDDVSDAEDDGAAIELVADDDAAEAPATPAPRLRILTAMYRHTVKGIDRGKWVVDVQEEADAPLAAVEAVLRGVRQRSTEPADPELVSPDMLATLLEPTRVAPAA